MRIEKVNTPLANPDALVFMIDWTLDECFSTLRPPLGRKRTANAVAADAKPDCPCGRNPLLAYFAAGEQAIEEALILEQARVSALDPAQRDMAFAELKLTFREIARREVEAFCAVCQLREASPSAASPVDLPAAGPTVIAPVETAPAPGA